MDRIFSVLYWSFLAGTSMVFYPIAVLIWLVTMPFGPGRAVLHRYYLLVGQLYVRACRAAGARRGA